MMHVFSAMFFRKTWYLGLGSSLLGLLGVLTLAQADNTTTTTDPNQILSDYTEHKSQFFNYNVYKDLTLPNNAQATDSELKPLATTSSASYKHATKSTNKQLSQTTKSQSSTTDTSLANTPLVTTMPITKATSTQAIFPDIEIPIIKLKRQYSKLYFGFGQMSDTTNKVHYKEFIYGTKSYKFLWVNSKQNLGFYTGLDLNYGLGYRKAGGNYLNEFNKTTDNLQLTSSSADDDHTANKRQVFDPILYHNYDAYGLNIGLVLLAGFKYNIYQQFSIVTELGGGINYNLFTVPQKGFYKQILNSFKYSVVGGQIQNYLGFDYNSVIECGVIVAASSSGFVSFGGLITFTF